MPPIGHLRPLGLGEILDRAFALYRGHFVTLFTTAGLGILPMMLFMGIVFPLGGVTENDPAAAAAMGGGMLLVFPVIVAATVAMWGALTHQLSRAYLGGEISVGDGYRVGFRRFFPLLGAGILAMMAVMVGLVLCIVPGVLAMIALFAIVPAVVLEGRGPVEALSRSHQLSRGAWGTIFLTFLVILLIAYAPAMAVGMVGMIGMLAAGAAESEAAMAGAMVGYQVLNLFVSALTTPFLVAGIVLLYYDRRVRSEALDLELAADALRPTAG